MLAPTALRVQRNTRPEVNRDIIELTARNIDYYRRHPAAIHDRLAALDREWDIERALELGSASLTLLGLGLGLTTKKRWLALSAIVQGFFMQHVVEGWCPPLPFFRRLGIRTAREIETERHALKIFLTEYERENPPTPTSPSPSAISSDDDDDSVFENEEEAEQWVGRGRPAESGTD